MGTRLPNIQNSLKEDSINLLKILQIYKDKYVQFHIVDNIILTTKQTAKELRVSPSQIDELNPLEGLELNQPRILQKCKDNNLQCHTVSNMTVNTAINRFRASP